MFGCIIERRDGIEAWKCLGEFQNYEAAQVEALRCHLPERKLLYIFDKNIEGKKFDVSECFDAIERFRLHKIKSYGSIERCYFRNRDGSISGIYTNSGHPVNISMEEFCELALGELESWRKSFAEGIVIYKIVHEDDTKKKRIKTFYSIRWDSDNGDASYGSTRKREAIRMAKKLAKELEFKEKVWIDICTTDDDYSEESITIYAPDDED